MFNKAWLDFRGSPKWCNASSAEKVGNNISGEAISIAVEGNVSSGNTVEFCEVSEAVRNENKLRRYSMEIRTAKAAIQKERHTKSVTLLAASAKLKSDMLEGKYEIAVFSRPEIDCLESTKLCFK